MADTASRSERSDEHHSTAAIEPDSGESSLDPDDIYHILQTSRRRDVLRYLRTADEPVRLRELAEQIAAWEHETTVENLNSSQRQRVYISLYQSHLPKLDTREIVEYNKDRGTVESTARAAQFEPYLSGLGGSSTDPWPFRYAATVGGCGLGLGAVAAGLLPVSWPVAAAVVVLSFAVVTTLHAYSVRLGNLES